MIVGCGGVSRSNSNRSATPRVVATPKRFLTRDQEKALAGVRAVRHAHPGLAHAGLQWASRVARQRVDLIRRRIEVVRPSPKFTIAWSSAQNHQRCSVPIPVSWPTAVNHMDGSEPVWACTSGSSRQSDVPRGWESNQLYH